MVSEAIRRRFLQDPLPKRLGNLASDLARIATYSEDPEERDIVASLLEEGKWFAEWAAPEAPLETQAMLADVQLALVIWERNWQKGVSIPTMAADARQKSNELLELAGLITCR